MGEAQRIKHVFIVRIWQEPAVDGQPGPWRGSVEHIPEAAPRYFTQLNDLQQFITGWVGNPAPEADVDTEPPTRAG